MALSASPRSLRLRHLKASVANAEPQRVRDHSTRITSTGFDSAALERGAKALRAITSSSCAKKLLPGMILFWVFEVMKKQEETRRTEFAAKGAEFKAVHAQSETERQKVIYEE